MKTRAEKKSIIENLEENLRNAKAVILLNLHKLSTANLFKLKKGLKQNSCDLKIIKKTLFGLVEKNFDKSRIKGPFALIFDFSQNLKSFGILGALKKEIQLEVFGGLLRDKTVSEEEVWNITKLPSENELRSQLVFVLKSCFQKLTSTVKSPFSKLVLVLNQVSQKLTAE
jgi:ribosomal protein L10